MINSDYNKMIIGQYVWLKCLNFIYEEIEKLHLDYVPVLAGEWTKLRKT